MNRDKLYSIQEIAKVSGVTVRTLRHYDRIGLLQSVGRNAAGHRFYNYKQLLQLQQILFYKELHFSLESIRELLHRSDFDIAQALKDHKSNMNDQIIRLQQLVKTIDKTILHITKEQKMTNDDLYKGFSKQKAKQYRKESIELYGEEMVTNSEEKLKSMGKDGIEKLKKDSDEIYSNMAEYMKESLDPSDEKVQLLVSKHYEMIRFFYEPTMQIYSGLAEMYVVNGEFKVYYENIATGLAEFLSSAMKVFIYKNSEK